MGLVDVVVMTKEEGTIAQLLTTLESSAVGQFAHVYPTMNELRAHLSAEEARHSFAVALVDVDQDTQQVLHELGRISAVCSQAAYVVISHNFDEQQVLQAMQAGARHFLRKSTIVQELDTVLERLVDYRREFSHDDGQTISVFSCQGGCGATTIAVNLATELQLATSKKVLAVDLDSHYGAMAPFLGVEGDYGIAHLLERAESLDRDLIASVVVEGRDGVDVLLSPASTRNEETLRFDSRRLVPVLKFCQSMYEYIVIDAPRLDAQTHRGLAEVSRLIIPVFQLTVPGINFAGALVKDLIKQGLLPERILPLANRVHRTNVPLDDAYRAIALDTLMAVRSDWGRASKSVNHGQPLADTAPRSKLRRDLKKCCAQILTSMASGN
ncbi:AAA family ATPase [Planctomycetota bacterium]